MDTRTLFEGKAMIVGTEPFDLGKFPDVRVLGCNMTGIEHLPWAEINKRGIKVISLQGETKFLETITSTAEHTIGLMIALMRNYKDAFCPTIYTRNDLQGHKLRGKTLGIIGYGRVGKQVKRMAEGLGMKVLTLDEEDSQDDLCDLLKKSDVISIHIPLFCNRGFFTKEMFNMMKPTAYLINTSRSVVVEKGALTDALKNNIISGAAVDFIEDFALVEYARTHDNLILTPHIGGNTFEDRKATENFIKSKVKHFLNND